MLYSSFLTALAFAASALAQNPTDGFNPITKPAQGENVPTGSTYQIVWEPSAKHPGPITIGLLGGATPSTLSVVDTIAVGVDSTSGSYSWQVDETLGDLATYGIMITLDSDPTVFQYGFPFHVVKGAKESSTTVSSSATSSSATSSATGKATGKETTVSAIVTATETVSCSETSVIETKTASLSSAIFVNSTSTTFAVPSSTAGNSTTLSPSNTGGGSAPVTITSLVTSKTGVPIPPTTTASIVTAGAASFGASSLALLGGVAMAVLAL